MSELLIPRHLNIAEVNEHLLKVGNQLLATEYGNDACRAVAWDTARLLVRAGIQPSVDDLTPDNCQPDKKLIPLIFKGRIKWPWHTICIAEEVVFDPLVMQPMYYQPYIKLMFNTPVVRMMDSDPSEVIDFLKTTWRM